MNRLLCIATLLMLVLPASARAEDPVAEIWTLTDMKGVAHDVDATIAGGKNVVLVFWQTWCGPCKREAPKLAIAAAEHAEGLAFFGVISGGDRDVDDEKVRRYVEKYELPYPQIRDRDIALTRRYEVIGTPTILVLGPGREILFRGSHPPESWKSLEGQAAGR
jgi:thiol-disulfide isomerase/thioredoxin